MNPQGQATLSQNDFERLRTFIYKECGINLTDAKKTMLESRLTKRLKRLGLTSLSAYCDYALSPEGLKEELTSMIDVVTTNKTDFFRESNHFDYLTRHALPPLLGNNARNLTVWSAGCSTGEEPYTLAVVLSECRLAMPYFSFTVIATDISTQVLERAQQGIYDEERIDPVPAPLKKKYFLRSKNPEKRIVRVVPEVRDLVKFRRLNFMDGDFGFREPLDVIFCRNVIIYFDKKTQEVLLNKFARSLHPGGYLFVGHSETLFGMDVPFTQVAPTIYRRNR